MRSIFRQIVAAPCLLCGLGRVSDGAVCAACRADLPWLPEAVCPQCAQPSPGGARCGHCLAAPPAFDTTTAALAYALPVDALISALKYDARLEIAPFLAGSLISRLEDTPGIDVLLPLPLHASRLRERGFNQALEIARPLARAFKLPVAPRLCRRTRATPPQVGLTRAQRRKNLRGAFTVDTNVQGLRIAIVDDVMTSGSSLDELAATLKQAGAAAVSAWVVARAL
jgi:ComF family protein